MFSFSLKPGGQPHVGVPFKTKQRCLHLFLYSGGHSLEKLDLSVLVTLELTLVNSSTIQEVLHYYTTSLAKLSLMCILKQLGEKKTMWCNLASRTYIRSKD